MPEASRQHSIVLFLMAALGCLALAFPAPSWWLGVGLITAVISSLLPGRQTSDHRREQGGYQQLAQDAIAILLVLALAMVIYHRAALGERPVNGDHTAHFFRFWYFITHLLPSGELFGWSNLWFAGRPVGYLYALGSNIWITLIYGIGFGNLTLEQAYGIAVYLAYAAEGLAVYTFGRYAFGRSTGLIAAVLFLTDEGTTKLNTGGWAFTAKLGVWPNSFSIAFSTFALIALLEIMRRGSWRAVGSFAFLAGFSLIVHPIQLLNLPILCSLTVATALLFGQLKPWKNRVLKLTIAAVLTGLIASLWILPFLSARYYTYSAGVPWLDLQQIGDRLRQTTLMPGMWSFSAVLGFLGVPLMLLSRKVKCFLPGLLVVGFLLLASKEGGELIALLVSDKLARKLEYIRFTTLLRPFWFIAAAHALSSLLLLGIRYRREQSNHLRYWPSLLCTVVAVTVVTPFACSFARSFYTEHVKREMFHHNDRKNLESRSEFVEWINDISAKDERFFRVALIDKMFYPRFIDLGISLKVPLYKIGWTPVSGYRYHLYKYDPLILRLLGVRYVLLTPQAQSILKQVSRNYDYWFKPLKKMDKMLVTEFRLWNSQRFEILQGEGDVRVEKFDEEEIILEAASGSHGKLVLAVSYFDRWQATLDGQSVPISTSEIGVVNDEAFITVDLKPGRWRFTFQRQWPERLSPFLFLFGFLVSIVLILKRQTSQEIP